MVASLRAPRSLASSLVRGLANPFVGNFETRWACIDLPSWRGVILRLRLTLGVGNAVSKLIGNGVSLKKGPTPWGNSLRYKIQYKEDMEDMTGGPLVQYFST